MIVDDKLFLTSGVPSASQLVGKSHAEAATIFRDELDTGRFQCSREDLKRCLPWGGLGIFDSDKSPNC